MNKIVTVQGQDVFQWIPQKRTTYLYFSSFAKEVEQDDEMGSEGHMIAKYRRIGQQVDRGRRNESL